MNKVKIRSLALEMLDILNRNPPVASGIQWGFNVFKDHLNGRSPVEILSALNWLKIIGAVKEFEGEIRITDSGRRLIND